MVVTVAPIVPLIRVPAVVHIVVSRGATRAAAVALCGTRTRRPTPPRVTPAVPTVPAVGAPAVVCVVAAAGRAGVSGGAAVPLLRGVVSRPTRPLHRPPAIILVVVTSAARGKIAV